MYTLIVFKYNTNSDIAPANSGTQKVFVSYIMGRATGTYKPISY